MKTDKETRRQGDKETRRQGEGEKRRRGHKETEANPSLGAVAGSRDRATDADRRSPDAAHPGDLRSTQVTRSGGSRHSKADRRLSPLLLFSSSPLLLFSSSHPSSLIPLYKLLPQYLLDFV